jgi:hypothetical protein
MIPPLIRILRVYTKYRNFQYTEWIIFRFTGEDIHVSLFRALDAIFLSLGLRWVIISSA